MFTGIIQHMVAVESIDVTPYGKKLVLNCGEWPGNPTIGESICVDGCCLTVKEIPRGSLAFDVVQQTLQHTTIGDLRCGDMVNVERALRADSLLGGHMVQGHVDTTALVLEVDRANGQWRARIDGVSLTIATKGQGWFEVALIPETLAKTALRLRLKGARVNIEADSMAKIIAAEVARQMQLLRIPGV